MSSQLEDGLWVLRRWNSFTPRIPSIDTGPGGGYFLKWNNKGIVIDPGFDYLDNLQRARVSLKSLDAIVVTHCHPDHCSDFEPLLMMLSERCERMNAHGLGETRRLDLFLSMDTTEKYAQILTQKSPILNDSRSPELDRKGTKDLPDYHMRIQTLPANHVKNMSESQTSPIRKAVSIIFHLYSDSGLLDCNRSLSVGFTSDTRHSGELAQEMSQCEIVIAHLGSVNFARLIRTARLISVATSQDSDQPKQIEQMRSELRDTNLKQGDKQVFADILSLAERSDSLVLRELDNVLVGKTTSGDGYQSGHLLFEGTLKLFEDIFRKKAARTKIGIVSEYGLELGSFRHKVAEVINTALFDSPQGSGERRIISGDRDLAISLSMAKQKCAHLAMDKCNTAECLKSEAEFLFRCTLCHQWVCLPCIKEHSIRHYDQSIFYNCDICSRRSYYPSIPVIRL